VLETFAKASVDAKVKMAGKFGRRVIAKRSRRRNMRSMLSRHLVRIGAAIQLVDFCELLKPSRSARSAFRDRSASGGGFL